jgi:cation-transporting ATPase E
VKTTSIALGIGVIAAAAIEIIWWVQGAVLGERRRLWRSADESEADD